MASVTGLCNLQGVESSFLSSVPAMGPVALLFSAFKPVLDQFACSSNTKSVALLRWIEYCTGTAAEIGTETTYRAALKVPSPTT